MSESALSDRDAAVAELPPCPFCGAGASLYQRGSAMSVKCTNSRCGARMFADGDNNDPARMWCRRVEQAQEQAPMHSGEANSQSRKQ